MLHEGGDGRALAAHENRGEALSTDGEARSIAVAVPGSMVIAEFAALSAGPSVVNTSRRTVVGCSLGFASTMIDERPVVVAPPTSHCDAAGDVQAAPESPAISASSAEVHDMPPSTESPTGACTDVSSAPSTLPIGSCAVSAPSSSGTTGFASETGTIDVDPPSPDCTRSCRARTRSAARRPWA